jgi:hypothetical protein
MALEERRGEKARVRLHVQYCTVQYCTVLYSSIAYVTLQKAEFPKFASGNPWSDRIY